MERHKEQNAEEKCDHRWKYDETPYAVEYFESWMRRNAAGSGGDGSIMLEHEIPYKSKNRIIKKLTPIIQAEIETLKQEADAMPLLPVEIMETRRPKFPSPNTEPPK